MASSWFADVSQASPIEVFKLTADYKQDAADQKYNLGVGGTCRSKLHTCHVGIVAILAVKLKMINQDRMIFGDFSVNFEPIPLKFCRGHFLLKS